jgi:hypothetical protein
MSENYEHIHFLHVLAYEHNIFFIECKNSIHTSWRYKLQQKYMNGRIENSPVAGDWMVASGRRMVRVVACSRTTRVWSPEDNTSNSSGWYWQQHPKNDQNLVLSPSLHCGNPSCLPRSHTNSWLGGRPGDGVDKDNQPGVGNEEDWTHRSSKHTTLATLPEGAKGYSGGP